MTRTKLKDILQKETDSFKEPSRLRDDILDAMEIAYVAGKREPLNIDSVVGQSEQLPCGDCENYAEYDGGIKYCSVCGTKLS